MTDKQQEKFIQFYQWLYGDTSKDTGTGELPTIFEDEEELHKNMWKLTLKKILGKTRYNKKYYRNKLTKLCYGEYVFEWLWLGYGPTVLNYNDTINNAGDKTRG